MKLKKNDTQKPVEGYYIEKTTSEAPAVKSDKDDDDDDIIDTNIHPEEKLSKSPKNIAPILNEKFSEIGDRLNQAVDKASNTGLESKDPTDQFFTQAQGLAESIDPNDIFKIDFGKSYNGYGKSEYQYVNYKYTDNGRDIKMVQNALELEAGGTYQSKSGNTKGVFFCTAIRSYTNTDYIMQKEAEEAQDAKEEADSSTENYPSVVNENDTKNIYSLYLAGQQKFKNGDILTANGFYNIDEAHKSNTTAINADYYLHQFGAHISGSTTIYNGTGNVHTTKTHINCTFNPEEHEQHKTNNTSNNSKGAPAPIQHIIPDNKWKLSISPFIGTDEIEGSTETQNLVQVFPENIFLFQTLHTQVLEAIYPILLTKMFTHIYKGAILTGDIRKEH